MKTPIYFQPSLANESSFVRNENFASKRANTENVQQIHLTNSTMTHQFYLPDRNYTAPTLPRNVTGNFADEKNVAIPNSVDGKL